MGKVSKLQFSKAALTATVSSIAILTAAPIAAAQTPDQTAVAQVPVNIPAGPLSRSILAISNAFGVDILAPSELVAGKAVPAVSNALTAEEALQRALAGSGLTYKSTDGAFVIARAGRRPQSSGAREAKAQEIITVTAQLREQRLQDVPISMSIFNDADILDNNIAGTADIVLRTPNVFQTQAGSRGQASSLSIRGVTSSNADFATPTVAIVQDGLKNIGGYDFSFFDVDRVEVLRGPQGTLYGAGSPGGVISVVSKRPTDVWDGLVDLTYRNFENRSGADEMQARAAFGGPINDALSFRLTGSALLSDGYVENTFLDDDAEDREEYSFRGQVLFTPTDDWEVLLNLSGYRYDGSFGAFAPVEALESAPWTVTNNTLGDQEQSANVQILTVKHWIGDLEVTSITGARQWDSQETLDVDYTPDQLAVDSSGRELEQFSEEIRLASPSNRDGLEWLVGGFFGKETQTTIGGFSYFPPLSGVTAPSTDGGQREIKQTNYAVFGQVKAPITDRLFLTGGLRYDFAKRKVVSEPVFTFAGMAFPEPPLEGEADFDALLPKVSLEFRQSDALTVYASVARGYKPGGYPSFNFRAGNESYDSEFSWNYELGAKANLIDNRVQLGAALFYIDMTDQQFTTHIAPNVIAIDNIGKSHSIGFEVELEAALTPEIDAFASVGYVDAEIDELDAATPSGAVEGGRPANVPDIQTGFGLSYDAGTGFHARGAITFIGDYFLNGGNTLRQDSYALLNMSAGWRFEHFDVSLFADNLLNEQYLVRAFGGTLPSQTFVARQGAPRSFGGVLRADF